MWLHMSSQDSLVFQPLFRCPNFSFNKKYPFVSKTHKLFQATRVYTQRQLLNVITLFELFTYSKSNAASAQCSLDAGITLKWMNIHKGTYFFNWFVWNVWIDLRRSRNNLASSPFSCECQHNRLLLVSGSLPGSQSLLRSASTSCDLISV